MRPWRDPRKIGNKGGNILFFSNIGTHQGDSLSQVLFILYLEAALKIRDLTQALDQKEAHLPSEVAYKSRQIRQVGQRRTYLPTNVHILLQKYVSFIAGRV